MSQRENENTGQGRKDVVKWGVKTRGQQQELGRRTLSCKGK